MLKGRGQLPSAPGARVNPSPLLVNLVKPCVGASLSPLSGAAAWKLLVSCLPTQRTVVKSSVNEVCECILEFSKGNRLVVRRTDQPPGLPRPFQELLFRVPKKRQ